MIDMNYNIANSRFDSIILPEINHFVDLLSLCEFPVDQKWNLIYRATQDGFEASSFHAKCNNKPNTLVIIKSTNGNVFGGYTEQSWSGIGCEADPNEFIFSFINKVPHDFQIADKSNTNTDSNSYLGNYYTHLKYEYGLTEDHF